MIEPIVEEAHVGAGDRQLRQFAWVWLVFFGALTWYKGIEPHDNTRAWILGALTLVVWLAGVARPPSIRWLYTGLMAIALPIGWLVSNLLLALVLYLVFTPMGWLFRLIGRDPLSRRSREKATFWEPLKPSDDVRRYYHQY